MPETVNTSNYVGAWIEWDGDSGVDYNHAKVAVLERDENGEARKVVYQSPHYFYVEDEAGEYESLFGHKVTRVEFESRNAFKEAKEWYRNSNNFPERNYRAPRTFETDFQPLQRVLMENYYGRPTPTVNFALFDIEVDYNQAGGFPSPIPAYAPINAITTYQSWTKKFLTLVVPPLVKNPDDPDGPMIRWNKVPGNDVAKLESEITSLIDHNLLRDGVMPEISIVEDELELIRYFLQDIANADIISGWNSEFYDLPYIYMRLEKLKEIHGADFVRQLDYPDVRQRPKPNMVNRFGSEELTIKLFGRSHLDYMRLFQKFTFEGRVSYSLGNILQEEVGVGKIEFAGTLEQLYKLDFPKFVAYNFRDVDGILQLDEKFKFIALANQMAHENTVGFSAVLGTVSYVETGITNHAHYVLKKIVHDKNIKDHDKVEGAIVLNPRIGLHEWLAAVDLKSLYPNTIRSLNISPEKIIGQFVGAEAAWFAILHETDERLAMIYENGTQEVMTAREWRSELVDNFWAVSAYGTIFDQSGGRGVIADILGYWYEERKRLQGEKWKWDKEGDRLKANGGTPEEIAHAKEREEHFDLLQLTKKISMNSLYGALLNAAFRFGDERMGASVTGTGRQITTHMMETIAYVATGERSPLIKKVEYDEDEDKYINTYTCDSAAVIYGDTDSVASNSIIKTSYGEMEISQLFDALPLKWDVNGREFASAGHLKSTCFVDNTVIDKPVLAVYRHKVSKARWKITLENGKHVIVTNDHSVMVMRAGAVIEVKPGDINRDTDTCISIKG